MSEISGRIFLVGCPRSGTTMLQTVLAAHPEVHSFPESRFYRNVVSQQKLLRHLGVASHHAHARLSEIYVELGLDTGKLRRRFGVAGYARDLFAALDQAALAAGKPFWLEKTPDHLDHVDAIQQVCPDARFVHLIREGKETVASLLDVTRQYPDAWGREPWSVQRCVTRWCTDVAAALRLQDCPGHLLVSYERFVEAPEAETQRLCTFLGLIFDPAMIARESAVGEDVVLESEPWKARSGGAIQAGQGKFEQLLTDVEREAVLAGLGELPEQLAAYFSKHPCR